MALEETKKKGNLYKLPVKGIVKKWTKRWFVLYGTSHEGVVRLEYFDSKECAISGVGKRTIPLRESDSVSTAVGNKIHPYVFQFKSVIGHHILEAETQPEMDSWMEEIKDAVREDKAKQRRTKTQSRVITSSDSELSGTLERSGRSYKNEVDSGTYRIVIEENETSLRMNLSGTYNLELTPMKLILIAPSKTTIFSLLYKFLKNYGKQSGQFHFETGKNSPIGQGKLIFVTTCSKEIFGIVHSNIKRLKEVRTPTKLSASSIKKPEEATRPAQKPSPPQPYKKTSITGSRPNSRHSTEITDQPVSGTYRLSKTLDETKANDDATAVYAAVDMSKKKSKKSGSKGDTNGKEALYEEPYESDPAYRAPSVPAHKTNRESRMSTALVELDESAFNDSFDDDDDENENGYEGNLEPLSEGATNPLDTIDFGSLADPMGNNYLPPLAEGTTKPPDGFDALENVMKNLTFDFAAGSLGTNVPTTTATTVGPTSFVGDLTFFGQAQPAGDPFSASLPESNPLPPVENMAEFDFGSLDANFFEKLETMEGKDQGPMMTGSEAAFWENTDTIM